MIDLYCPQGHPVADRTRATTNPGIRCRACEHDYACTRCGWTGPGPDGLLWLGSLDLAARGIIARGNPRDFGAYALCPGCAAAIVGLARNTGWFSVAHLLESGGSRVVWTAQHGRMRAVLPWHGQDVELCPATGMPRAACRCDQGHPLPPPEAIAAALAALPPAS